LRLKPARVGEYYPCLNSRVCCGTEINELFAGYSSSAVLIHDPFTQVADDDCIFDWGLDSQDHFGALADADGPFYKSGWKDGSGYGRPPVFTTETLASGVTSAHYAYDGDTGDDDADGFYMPLSGSLQYSGAGEITSMTFAVWVKSTYYTNNVSERILGRGGPRVWEERASVAQNILHVHWLAGDLVLDTLYRVMLMTTVPSSTLTRTTTSTSESTLRDIRHSRLRIHT
jgi:hypothetical protein